MVSDKEKKMLAGAGLGYLLLSNRGDTPNGGGGGGDGSGDGDGNGGGGTNQAPTAVVGYGVTGSTLNLDGSASSDPDGSIVSYEWRVLRDGSEISTANGMTTSVGMAGDGDYTVELRVTDDAGATTEATETFRYDQNDGGGSNQPPVASIESWDLSGTTLSATSDSLDVDGTVVTENWYLYTPSGGLYNSKSGSSVSFDMSGLPTGDYRLEVEAVDDDGASETRDTLVWYDAPDDGDDGDGGGGGTSGPTASFSTSVASDGGSVTCDASSSSGDISSYSWDLSYGGISYGSASGSTATFDLGWAGTWTVTLTVEGPNGSDSTSKTVTV